MTSDAIKTLEDIGNAIASTEKAVVTTSTTTAPSKITITSLIINVVGGISTIVYLIYNFVKEPTHCSNSTIIFGNMTL